MLTFQEIEQLRNLLEKKNRSNDIRNRLRDSKGRFTAENPYELQIPEESASRYKERRIKVVWVKGSYVKFLIKDVWLREIVSLRKEDVNLQAKEIVIREEITKNPSTVPSPKNNNFFPI